MDATWWGATQCNTTFCNVLGLQLWPLAMLARVSGSRHSRTLIHFYLIHLKYFYPRFLLKRTRPTVRLQDGSTSGCCGVGSSDNHPPFFLSHFFLSFWRQGCVHLTACLVPPNYTFAFRCSAGHYSTVFAEVKHRKANSCVYVQCRQEEASLCTHACLRQQNISSLPRTGSIPWCRSYFERNRDKRKFKLSVMPSGQGFEEHVQGLIW